MIFDKTVNEGYGSHRMSEFLTELGITTHKGANFQSTTINRLLKNRIYCGYFVQKDVVSPKQDDLVIIDENVFDMAQEILYQRSHRQEEKSHIAMSTKSNSLLSGCIFCGHCGTRIVATTINYKYGVWNGTPLKENRRAYICYHRSRRLNDCDGQSVYQADKVEEIVLRIVKSYLGQIKRMPKDRALELKYEKQISEKQAEIKRLKKQEADFDEQLESLSSEIGKALLGRSLFPMDLLQKSIEKTQKDLENTRAALVMCREEVENVSNTKSKLGFYYEKFLGWANEFNEAPIEHKKMIISQLFSSIKISRGYQIEAALNTTYKQFFE